MKAKYKFEILEIDDDIVAVPVGAGTEEYPSVLRLNETAKLILKELEKDTDEAKIVEALMKEYAGDKDEIARHTHEYLEKLIAEGLVV